ncbi:DUF951 domain-containing protein [Bombilactobacillus bombi]|uniref:DUF951 domain-containing protein n=1 Tax=Bombilactobacillus bombi TaxID=1303590 RepID=UPI0015E5C591|nr:DUF951 domain-containing protein [Bombilactobacillus bombi]MBA1394108.1 DUF951 domain-containing protein [Lactobacillus sp. XV13L]MBA1434121.1 DUF951 domain-containing protein [Bombilactobacillus bombi]
MYNLGDIVMMKKPHACSQNRWEITRLGADIKICCLGCGHTVMLKRSYFNKRFKKIITQAHEVKQDQEEFYLDPQKLKLPKLFN